MSATAEPEPAADAAQEGADKTPAGPSLNSLEQALADAKTRMDAEPGTAFRPPPEKPDTEEKPAAESDDKPAAEAEGEVEPDATEDEATAEAEDAGGDAATEETTKPEGEDGAESAKPEGDAEGAAKDDAASEEVAEGEDDPELVVGLPPRREGDEEIEIVAESKETAERLRQLKNAAIRGAELESVQAQITKDQGQIEDLEVYISTDPTGFILSNVPTEVIDEVTMSLLTTPEVWARLQEKVRALEDPAELRVVTAELKASRADSQNRLRQAVETRRYAKEQGRIVRDSIAKMVPETDGIAASRRDAIMQTLVQEAARLIREKKISKVDPADLPLMLAIPLRAHGIEPMAAQANLKGDGAPSTPAAKKPSAKKKQPTKAQLKKASDKRAKAAAGTPPGGAAPAARKKLPAGQRLEDRIAAAREAVASGAGLGSLMGS